MTSIELDPTTAKQIKRYRKRLREIDLQILDFLAFRVELSKEIGDFKRSNDIDVLQNDEWTKKLELLLEEAKSKGLDEDLVRDVFDRVHDYSVSIQRD